jgi:hypothetical protein
MLVARLVAAGSTLVQLCPSRFVLSATFYRRSQLFQPAGLMVSTSSLDRLLHGQNKGQELVAWVWIPFRLQQKNYVVG